MSDSDKDEKKETETKVEEKRDVTPVEKGDLISVEKRDVKSEVLKVGKHDPKKGSDDDVE